MMIDLDISKSFRAGTLVILSSCVVAASGFLFAAEPKPEVWVIVGVGTNAAAAKCGIDKPTADVLTRHSIRDAGLGVSAIARDPYMVVLMNWDVAPAAELCIAKIDTTVRVDSEERTVRGITHGANLPTTILCESSWFGHSPMAIARQEFARRLDEQVRQCLSQLRY